MMKIKLANKLLSFIFLIMLSVSVWAWVPVVSSMNEKTTISEADVKGIFFFFHKEWDLSVGKVPITVVLFEDDTQAFKDFSINVLEVKPEIYAEYIKSKIEDGSIRRPIRVNYDAEMRVKVADNMYAIGYLNEKMYVNTPYGLKFLKVVK